MATDFLPTVEAEVTALRCFVSLLEREQKLLGKGEVDHLLDLLPEKNGLAAELAALAGQRSTMLAAEGLTPDRAGVAAWFAAHPGEARARAAWAVLLPLASQARELNRVNGELIHLRLQHHTRALEALLGSAGACALYGPDGQNAQPSGGRISDRA